MKTIKINAAEVVKDMPKKELKNYNITLEQIDDSSSYIPDWFKPFYKEFKDFVTNQQKFNDKVTTFMVDQQKFNEYVIKQFEAHGWTK